MLVLNQDSKAQEFVRSHYFSQVLEKLMRNKVRSRKKKLTCKKFLIYKKQVQKLRVLSRVTKIYIIITISSHSINH